MENLNNSNINGKTAANAVSTYFFVFVSWLLLFNETNENINNNFVKSHIKSSSLIHLGFIITYVIFVHYSLFSSINLLGIGLNHIIAKGIFLGLFFLLTIGMYKAHNKKYFFANDIISIVKKEQLIDVNDDKVFDEKDKLTIILAYIPFVGFYNYPKFKDNQIIKNITKLNLIITLILLLLYLNTNYNISNIILLFYIVFVVFIGINIFVQNNIINVNLSKIITINKLNFIIKTTIIYLKNYYKENSEFKSFNEILNKKTLEYKLEQEKEEQELKLLKNTKLPKFLIYIPFINIIFFFSKKTIQKIHISNGLTITLIISILLILDVLNYYNSNIYLLFIIPITYGIGYLQTKQSYKMPFIYEIYEFLYKIFSFFIFKSKQINQIRKREEIINLKVEEK